MNTPDQPRLVRFPEVIARVGISRPHLYRLMKAGKFPPSTRISHKVAVWRADEIDSWILSVGAAR